MLTWLGIGTQIDGLGHFGIDHVYYNGNKVADFWRPDGLAKFGTHEIPPIVTRGVLLDIARHRGVDRLEGGSEITRAEIAATAKAQRVAIGRGDVVLLHTGWQSLAMSDPEKFLSSEPGLGLEGAEYLIARGVVAIGADTWGLDQLPGPDPAIVFPVHQLLLAKSGVYILENIQDPPTSRRIKATSFSSSWVSRASRGAVQMVINPVAIR